MVNRLITQIGNHIKQNNPGVFIKLKINIYLNIKVRLVLIKKTGHFIIQKQHNKNI